MLGGGAARFECSRARQAPPEQDLLWDEEPLRGQVRRGRLRGVCASHAPCTAAQVRWMVRLETLTQAVLEACVGSPGAPPAAGDANLKCATRSCISAVSAAMTQTFAFNCERARRWSAASLTRCWFSVSQLPSPNS